MSFNEGHDGNPCCSFCGKREGQVKRLISGRGVYICDECVDFCKSMLEEEKESDAAEQLVNADLPKPQEIKAILDEYVIGQDEAKRPCLWLYIIITKESITKSRIRSLNVTWSCRSPIF